MKYSSSNILLIFALLIGVLADVLFYKHTPGISVPIFFLVGFLLLYAVDRASFSRLKKADLWLMGVVLALSLFFAIRASETLLFMDAGAMMLILVILFGKVYGARISSFDFLQYFSLVFIDIPTAWMTSIPSPKQFTGLTSRGRKILLGVVIAVALSIVFGVLFVSADEVAREFVRRFFEWASLDVVFRHIVIVGIFSFAALAILAPVIAESITQKEHKMFMFLMARGLEGTIALVALNIVFLGFLAIQGVYLFGGADLTSFGLTYSEYAVKGFYQLIVVAFLVGVVLWGFRHFHLEHFERVSKALKTALLIETTAVIVSAWVRISMYTDAYGLTAERVIGVWAILVVLSWLIILCVSVFRADIKNSRLILSGIFTLAGWVLLLNIVNPDLIVAEINIKRAEFGLEPQIDIEYLMKLSDDARPTVVEYLSDKANTDPDIVKGQKRIDYMYGVGRKYDLSWQAYNWAHRKAIGAVWVAY